MLGTTLVDAQITRKPIVEIDAIESALPNDSNHFYISKIDTTIFKTILESKPKLIVEMWQPWCGSASLTIPNLVAMRNKMNAAGYSYILLSDNQSGLDYYKITDNKMGLIAFYFNKYNINFPTYIIGKGEELKIYMQIVSRFVTNKKKKDFPVTVIENRKAIYRNYPYTFYKKFL